MRTVDTAIIAVKRAYMPMERPFVLAMAGQTPLARWCSVFSDAGQSAGAIPR
jgi:hypothetical protein